MATFAAYFDDSGTHDDATNVVCGGVAGDSQQMLGLESDWNAVLRMREYDLDYLHMKEMKSGKGKFAKFQHDLQLQRSLQGVLGFVEPAKILQRVAQVAMRLRVIG